MPSSSFKITSEGTPRIAEVTGATVTVDKYAMALLRVSTRTGRPQVYLAIIYGVPSSCYHHLFP